MALGYIPSIERLQLPPRRPPLWLRTPWSDAVAIDGIGSPRPARRGLVLDLDDTLYPHERFVQSGFAAVARSIASAHGLAAEEVYVTLARARAGGRGRELQAMCDRFALPHDIVPGLVDVFRRHLPALWLNHGVANALHRLRAAGWRLGILTNGLPSVQFRKVAALGLAPLVDEVVYAEEHAPGGKPAAAAFRAVLRALDLAPEHAVFVGDDPVNDVRGAKAAGFRTIRLACGRLPAAACPLDDADMVIHSVAELPAAAAALLEMVAADVA